MKEILKDAPCLCKDEDMEVPVKRNFFQKILYNWLRKRNRCYQYPVLYSDRTISNAKCERIGRKPLGIIFENHLIALKDSPNSIDWYDAMEYCQKIKIFGQSCEAGEIEFWEKYRWHKQGLNTQLKSFGGEPLKLNKCSYWSSSEYDRYSAWVFCAATGASRRCLGCLDWELKNYTSRNAPYVVRPVLDLSKVSL